MSHVFPCVLIISCVAVGTWHAISVAVGASAVGIGSFRARLANGETVKVPYCTTNIWIIHTAWRFLSEHLSSNATSHRRRLRVKQYGTRGKRCRSDCLPHIVSVLFHGRDRGCAGAFATACHRAFDAVSTL